MPRHKNNRKDAEKIRTKNVYGCLNLDIIQGGKDLIMSVSQTGIHIYKWKLRRQKTIFFLLFNPSCILKCASVQYDTVVISQICHNTLFDQIFPSGVYIFNYVDKIIAFHENKMAFEKVQMKHLSINCLASAYQHCIIIMRYIKRRYGVLSTPILFSTLNLYDKI